MLLDAVGAGEEGQDHGEEVILVVVEAVEPMAEVGGEFNLIGRPEGRHVLLDVVGAGEEGQDRGESVARRR